MKKRAGRKNKYETHVRPYLERIPKWRRQGMTEEQIANKLGIAVSTLNVYKNQHSELIDALKKGRAELVEELEDSLYQRAMGFDYTEEKIYMELDGDGRERKRQEKTTKKALPDTGALAFALKNLAPDRWKDRQSLEHTGSVDIETRAKEIREKLFNGEGVDQPSKDPAD